jgi:dihydroorotate dehydrogenase (NAD+) catalytic subunit
MHASVTVGSLVLEAPLVNGSGVIDATSSDQGWNLPARVLSKLGAFTTKTITLEPRPGNPQPWAETLDQGTLINAAGLPNPGIEAAAHDWAHLPDELGVPVIVSIGGAEDVLDTLAASIDVAGWASAIELNLSCPNVQGGLVAGDPHAVEQVVSCVRASTKLPLLAKLTAATGAPAEVARAAVAAGADGLTCGNTIPARAVTAIGAAMLGAGPHGGMSGRGLHPINLRLVADVAAAVDVPVIGLGGVDSTAAADRMLDAGARIVGIGTGAVFDPDLIGTLARHLSTPRPSTAR